MDKNLILLISFIILSSQGTGLELKCEDEGCYEVIKTFVKLLEDKINETDKILKEAELELNEVAFGNDEKFRDSIVDLDSRLSKLILEMNTGIDGGEHSLFELINSVFKELNQVDMNTDKIELALDDGSKITKIADVDVKDIKEAIKKIHEQFSKVQNQTNVDLPNALQDAFDRSEKFHSDTKELHDVLELMRTLLADYERNLMNAKDLTSQTVQKFTEVTEQIDTTSEFQKIIEEILKDQKEFEFPVHELENVKKLVSDASDKARAVFDESLELLNEASVLELFSKFDDIKNRIKELDEYSPTAEKNLREFTEENSKLLDVIESTLDEAEELQIRAKQQQQEIENLLHEIKDIEKTSKKAVDDKDEIISNARNIYKVLEDFQMRIEESRMQAMQAFEKIPEVLKKISDSKGIVKSLEDKVEESMTVAKDAKQKCTASKTAIDQVLEESGNINTATEALADELDAIFETMSEIHKSQEQNLKSHDNLKKKENKTEDMIQNVKVKMERTRMKEKEVNEKVANALRELEGVMKLLDEYKDVDPEILKEFESKIDKLENEIEKSGLNEHHQTLKQQRQVQDELIEKYRVEIAVLEHEVKTIKDNADSLQNKCFKRTRLEP